tara:strand:+ start:719 stop:1597 length:879 start_codon:yes stop_codon:yes gene_type:complete
LIKKNKFILGTAQFSKSYGLIGKKKLLIPDIKKILKYVIKKRIYSLDNSLNYTGSQKKISLLKKKNWQIITKLKFSKKNLIKKDKKFLKSYVLKKIMLSKKELNIQKFDVLLINNFEIFNYNSKKKIYQILKSIKKEKIINKFGYSIYNFKKLDKTIKDFCPDVIQCSYNIFDRRLNDKKLIKLIKKKRVEIHARSIFLQGLLLCSLNHVPKKFQKWKKIFLKWEKWTKEKKITKLEACLSFAFSNKHINKVVIGVKDVTELREILNTKIYKKIRFPSFLMKDKNLIDPYKW